MLQRKRHRFWTMGLLVLTLFAFLAGTSLACLQKSTGTLAMAEDCCQSHCQHAMTGEAAADCCQSQHTQAAPTFPSSAATKTFTPDIFALPVALISPAVLQSLESSCRLLATAEQPLPSPPFYTLHCALLI
jgi:hypothetical protein